MKIRLIYELDDIDEEKFEEWKKKFDNEPMQYGIHLGSLLLPLSVAMHSPISVRAALIEREPNE